YLALDARQLLARSAIDLVGSGQFVGEARRLFVEPPCALARTAELAFQLGGPPRKLFDLATRRMTARFQILGFARWQIDFALGDLDATVDLVEALLQSTQAPLFVHRGHARRFDLGLATRKLDLLGAAPGFEAARQLRRHFVFGNGPEPPVRSAPELDVLHLGLVPLVALGLLRLAPQRAQLLVDFAENVGHAQQVLPGGLHLSLGRLLLD